MNDNKKMTALVSLFALAYHRERYGVTVYDDPLSKRLLSEETYSAIAEEMTKGAPFFDSRLKGDPEPLRRVVDGFLSPAPLARAAFCAQSLETASRLGTTQYVLLGSGFDTFPYRQPDWAKRMTIFEVDRPEVIEEKQKRLSQSGIDVPDNVNFIGADLAEENWIKQLLSHPDFSPNAKTMCSLLGLVYYLTREAFSALVQSLSILPEGSGVVFDYPNQLSGKLPALAHGASAPMMAFYSERDLTALLSAQGFRICEHLSPLEAAEQFFRLHQLANPDSTLTAPPHVSYCLSVRK